MDPRASAFVQAHFPQHVSGLHDYRGQDTVLVKREGLLEVLQFLKADPSAAFDFLMDLTCVDYLRFGHTQHSAPRLATPSPLPYFMDAQPSAERWERGASNDTHRFELVYHLYATTRQHRLRVKVPLPASDPVADSATGLWEAANWFEREIWDMFGVRFTGHPNLKRLLLYEAFQGHPLRKDYPVNKRQPLIGPSY